MQLVDLEFRWLPAKVTETKAITDHRNCARSHIYTVEREPGRRILGIAYSTTFVWVFPL